jgi:hypothetical protein
MPKKMARGRRFPLFLLFLPEIISGRHCILRRNPGPPTVRRSAKQRDGLLF